MKVRIGRDERWPDYYVDLEPDGEIELSDELYQRHLKASEEYNAVQYELEKLVEERAKCNREETMAAAKEFMQPGSWKRPTTESILADLRKESK
jgi:hypothetical protein